MNDHGHGAESPEIHDLTECFRRAQWTGDPTHDQAMFDARIRRIDRGVYVHYLENEHEHPVHDRNGERHGKGKLLIQPQLATIKFGKFEGGLIRRRSQDAHHWHRRDPLLRKAIRGFPQAPGTFAECLRLALVLDLTGHEQTVIRDAERHLRREMRQFLHHSSVSVQDHKGDYRLLTSPPPANLASMVEEWARRQFREIVRLLRSAVVPARPGAGKER